MKSSRKFFLVPCLIFLLLTNSFASDEEDVTLRAPDGATVTIHRDSYGVPHISSDSEVGVFFAQGFAVARDRLYQLENHRRFAEGKLSEWFGAFTLNMDKETRTMFYTHEERIQQFDELPSAIKTMIQAYSDGINTYIDSMDVNPEKYKPVDFKFAFTMERWDVYKTIAIAQVLTRLFGQSGGQELERLQELQRDGQQVFDQNNPINDLSAPTTIQAIGSSSSRQWRYSGMHIRPQVVAKLKERQSENKLRAAEIGIPLKFGSFAVLITQHKSNTGNVMLLGAPQMESDPPKENDPSLVHEVELICPTFHVGGMTVAGLPSVIIGHTEYFAWTLTTGHSDNSDVYIDSTLDASYSKYFHNDEWLEFEVIQETLHSGNSETSFTHYRTVHGPVFGDDLTKHQVYSMKMTFWNKEIDMLKANYAWVKAKTLEEFEAAIAMLPFSFNVFYAGKDQQVKFWHVGRYQDRSDGVDPRLPHKGDGSEEWGGFIDFKDLPSATGTQQNYFVNWNNKPVSWWNNGDNIPWAGSTNRTTRVLRIDAFVGPINDFSFENLKNVPRQINDFGTYQQAIEFSSTAIIDENIIPPGQSAFVDLNGQKSPHFSDQWPLHVNWQFKDMEFAANVTTSVEPVELQPKEFTLRQNYPNPFNPRTTIKYQLPFSAHIVLRIYSIIGQEVKTLVDADKLSGSYSVVWDGKDNWGKEVSSGVYFYQLSAKKEHFRKTRKLLLLR